MTSYHLLTVVVPVYNEAATLRSSVKRLLDTDLPVDVEVLVVDDGSTDGSLDTVADLEQAGRIRVVQHPANRGKGSAVRTGIAHARGDLLTVLDADLEYDPSDLGRLLEPVLAGEAEIAYGTRTFSTHTAYSFWYVIGNRALAFWASFLYNAWLTDLETCLKLADIRLWREARLTADGFAIEAEVTGKWLRAGHRIYERPINYKARTRAEGKKLTWKDGVEALWTLLRVRLARRR